MSKNITVSPFVPQELIANKIYFIRGKKVMLDRDLAELYGVLTKALNQAVKRNPERFPEDFMFQLTKGETKNWKSQIVTSNSQKIKMGLRKRPFAFTALGISMLSSVLSSKTAIRVNMQIMRTFNKIREMLANNEMLRHKIEELERKY
ncbi:MAG: DNA-binding protein [Candidatus Omnitrophica bacterium CG07_land_8_20_14_0_80_50_8]|nr:MAG: DNA-binding protein [Candidatus Omnitrophica bacterium CG07_land_8_20_14_0_80_50_8]